MDNLKCFFCKKLIPFELYETGKVQMYDVEVVGISGTEIVNACSECKLALNLNEVGTEN